MQNIPIFSFLFVTSGATIVAFKIKKILFEDSYSKQSMKKHNDAISENDSLINARIPNMNNQMAFNSRDKVINPDYYKETIIDEARNHSKI